jgi:phosphoglycerol transferase
VAPRCLTRWIVSRAHRSADRLVGGREVARLVDGVTRGIVTIGDRWLRPQAEDSQAVNLTRDGVWALATGASAILIAAIILKIWRASVATPWSYSWDAFFYQGTVKAAIHHGWFLHVPELGAPFGLDSYDFPIVSSDWLQILLVKFLALFTKDVFTVVNVFLLTGFGLCGLVAFIVMRALHVRRGPAFVSSVLFAVLPYHFLKGEQQLFFSSYYGVPIGCLLVLNVLAGEQVLARRDGAGGRFVSLISRRSLLTIALCLLISGTGVYYAVLAALLVLAAGVLRSISLRAVAPVATALAITVTIGGFVGAAQLPTFLYQRVHGRNAVVAQRTSADSEYWGLKLDQMVFPIEGHRVRLLSRLGNKLVQTSRVQGEPVGNLGVLGALGLAWLMLIALATAIGGGRRVATERERHTAVATLTAFLIGTVGGISAIIAYTISPQIRTWGRMSVVVAFFSLLAVALIAERAGVRALTRGGRAIYGGALALVLLLGVLDQTSTRFVPDYALLSTFVRDDARFVDRIEALLPEHAMVLQLPYSEYPEGPVWNVGAYEPMRGYLQSADLRWSYGAMQGRPEDWLAAVEDMPISALLDGAAAAGFDGVWLDRSAYSDGGVAAVIGISRELGPAMIRSRDGRLVFFDLRPRREALRGRGSKRVAAMGEVTVRPVRRQFGSGFGLREASGQNRWWWADNRAELVLENPGRGVRRMRIDMRLLTSAPQPGTTRVILPGGKTVRVGIDRKGGRVLETIELPPGRSMIIFETVGTPLILPSADPRHLLVQVRNLILVPEELCRSSSSCTEGERPQLR